MESLRRTFGIAEPVRRGMELRICEVGEWRPSVLGGPSGVHADVLRGREAEMDWEDVWRGEWIEYCKGQDGKLIGSIGPGDETRGAVDFHTEMESRLRMNW